MLISDGNLRLHGWAGDVACSVDVRLYVPCETCEGEGVTYSAEWAAWIGEQNAAEQAAGLPWHSWNIETQESWLAEHPEPTEPEESPCVDCEGRTVTLTPEGQELINFLSTYLRSPV